MKFTYTHLATVAVILLMAVVALAACAPAPTPVPPTAVPTAIPPTPVPPTPVPPTAVPATATPAPAPTTANAQGAATGPQAKAVTLEIASNDKLGKFLTDGDGNTLYLLTKDTKNTSNCYDQCAQSWPPVIPQGAPTLMSGVNSALLGTATRKDGSTQLTYQGWPLYYFAKDQKPGDTAGQGVGGVWWVVSGEGNPIRPAGLTMASKDTLTKFLADANGNTLYMFTKDTKNTSNCYDKCEVAWPPLLTLDQPKLGDGINAALLGTTMRKDGTTQVTYNGWPLYYYFKDQKPGDTTGQAVGDVWWVVSGEGNIIKPAALKITQNDKLGKILTDVDGKSLYVFTKDTKDTSNCYDQCELAWPPLLEQGSPKLNDGVSSSLIGSTQRKDGSMQVTYNGAPLYYFAKDAKPGDTAGQGVGNVWYTVGADGSVVK